MGTRTATRQNMLASAIALLRERGTAAVTVDAVLARSDAPRGSVYHHFPGGRTQILTEALGLAGDAMSALIESAAADGASAGLRYFGELWRTMLRDSDFTAGCPVVSAAVGGSPDDQHLQAAAAAIFTRWQRALEQAVAAAGVAAPRARRLATTLVAALEGAVMLSRAQRTTEPLDEVLTELDELLAAAIR